MSPHLAIFHDPDADDARKIRNRRFGPHFEKPCRNHATIICAIERCRVSGECQYQRSQQK